MINMRRIIPREDLCRVSDPHLGLPATALLFWFTHNNPLHTAGSAGEHSGAFSYWRARYFHQELVETNIRHFLEISGGAVCENTNDRVSCSRTFSRPLVKCLENVWLSPCENRLMTFLIQRRETGRNQIPQDEHRLTQTISCCVLHIGEKTFSEV